MIGVEIEKKVVVPNPDSKLASDETLIVLTETDSSMIEQLWKIRI